MVGGRDALLIEESREKSNLLRMLEDTEAKQNHTLKEIQNHRIGDRELYFLKQGIGQMYDGLKNAPHEDEDQDRLKNNRYQEKSPTPKKVKTTETYKHKPLNSEDQ